MPLQLLDDLRLVADAERRRRQNNGQFGVFPEDFGERGERFGGAVKGGGFDCGGVLGGGLSASLLVSLFCRAPAGVADCTPSATPIAAIDPRRHSQAAKPLTKALAYVPSMPYTATGGLESAA